jgi:tRNA (guanine26-N2/guanine27-N2)-dimethyltransferase
MNTIENDQSQITLNEGRVSITVPHFDKVSAKALVFYNPVMELNRDLSVIALQTFRDSWDEDISICDAFGGTGIRGIRYSREIEGVQNVVINDLNPLAVQFTKENILKNGLDNVKVFKEDANILLRKCRGKFHVVDIDPFGTPSPFIESAAISIKAGGMLCITATDTSALCGTYEEPCIRKYSSMPLKTEYCHENGLRILAGFIARTFAKYKKFIVLKFSHSTEHYMRLYLTIGKGAKKTDNSLKNMGYIAHCPKCLYRRLIYGIAPSIPSKCPLCGETFQVGGPLWLGSMLDTDFIVNMMKILPSLPLKKDKESIKLLRRCYEESKGPATFYDLHRISKKLKISAPPLNEVLGKLKEEDYFASRTHIKPTGIKTDASLEILEEIILNLNSPLI